MICLGFITSQFNKVIVEKLLKGALARLSAEKFPLTSHDIYKVPGSYEIPFMAQRLCRLKKYDAIVCLGVLIRGETSHFDHIARASSCGIMQVSLAENVPIIFGILTVDDFEQAEKRSGEGIGNKGYEAVEAALQMVDCCQKISVDCQGHSV